MFVSQRAKEMVLRHEARMLFPSHPLVEMVWNTVYFTGCWVEWYQNCTDLLFTHSQLNTSLCNEAQGDEPILKFTKLWNRCIYQGRCLLMMEFIVLVCVYPCEGVTAVVSTCMCRQYVCNCTCKPLWHANVDYHRLLVLICYICNRFVGFQQKPPCTGRTKNVGDCHESLWDQLEGLVS